MVLCALTIINGDHHDAHRGKGFVHERVFISTNVFTHPGSAMNIQNGGERA